MGSESIAHGRRPNGLLTHSEAMRARSRNNCFSEIQLVGKKIENKKSLAS